MLARMWHIRDGAHGSQPRPIRSPSDMERPRPGIQRLAVAATNQWKHLRRSEYDVLDNNCLTTTLKIFRAYSRELKSLPEPSGMYKLPRVYLDRMLPHFGFRTRGSL
ncbi:hypothetical protein [Streptomyces mirabilis]|uniref:hypothetical protein n=1 Tax=Streptomyces mirabilis TaxID=68239 RepID=UPI0035DF8292